MKNLLGVMVEMSASRFAGLLQKAGVPTPKFAATAVALAAMITATPTCADIVKLKFIGSLATPWTGPAYPPFSAGALVFGTVIYDTSTAVPNSSLGSQGLTYFDTILPGSGFTIGGISLGFGPEAFTVVEDDDGFGHDIVTIVDQTTTIGPAVTGLPLSELALTFYDPTGSALSSYALPTGSSLVSDFSQTYISAFYGAGFDDFVLGSGSVVLSSVPEPASWALLLLGFGSLGVILRQTRRRLATALAHR